MQSLSIKSIKPLGVQNTLDFEVNHKDHNFYAEGIVVSNSHSVSYATMCAATAYLKFKYPKEFFVTLLNLTKDEPDPITEVSKIYRELSFFNIKLLPPHILKSEADFVIEGDNIRMGLSSVKNISEKALDKLKLFKHEYANKFEIFKAANLAGLNLSVVSALILVGSLDDMLTESRAKTQLEYVLWNLLTDNEKTWAMKLGDEYNFDLIKIIKLLNETIKDHKNKPIIRDSRRLTLRKHFQPYLEIYKFNQQNEKLTNWYMETYLLGFAYSTSLFDIYKGYIDHLRPISDVYAEQSNIKCTFVGRVLDMKMGKSKEKQTPYIKLYIKDNNENIKIMMFNAGKRQNITQCEENNGRLPQIGDVVIVTGIKKDGDTVFAETIGIQDTKIFLRISQLPKEKVDSLT